MRKLIFFPCRVVRFLFISVRVILKLAVYPAAALFLSLYAGLVVMLYQGPLVPVRALALWLAGLLKSAARFLFYFLFLYAYCMPLMPFAGWVPKGIPFHQMLVIPMLPVVIIYALYLATGKEGRVVRFIHRIYPVPYMVILLAWWYVLLSMWYWDPWSYAVIIPGAALSLPVARKLFPVLASKPFMVISFSAFAITIVFISFSTLTLNECGKMSGQEDVSAVLSYCEDGWDSNLGSRFSELLGKHTEVLRTHYGQARAAAPSPDGNKIFMSSMGRGRKFDPVRTFRVDRISREVDGVAAAVGGANDMDFYKKKNMLAQAASYRHVVQLLDMDTMELVKEFKFPGKAKPLWCRVDDEAGKLYVLFSQYAGTPESGTDRNQLAVIDLERLEIEKVHSLAHGDVNRGIYSSRSRRVYFVTGFAPDGDFLHVFDVDSGKSYHRGIRSFGWDLAHDENNGIVFVTYMFRTWKKGVVEMFSEEDLRSLGYVTTEYGVRHLDFDPASELLFTGNYLTGRVSVIDPYNDKLLAHYFVGRKIRRLSYSHEAEKLYVSSSNGFWEIDVSRFVRARLRGRGADSEAAPAAVRGGAAR